MANLSWQSFKQSRTAGGADKELEATSVSKFENNEWLPAADVEMKVGIRRLGGILPAGDEDTYITDSSGSVVDEFKKDSLPGDSTGNILLAVRIENSEISGNSEVTKSVPRGCNEIRYRIF